eukprot:PhM_4_TR1553/c0_g1_i1/m.105221
MSKSTSVRLLAIVATCIVVATFILPCASAKHLVIIPIGDGLTTGIAPHVQSETAAERFRHMSNGTLSWRKPFAEIMMRSILKRQCGLSLDGPFTGPYLSDGGARTSHAAMWGVLIPEIPHYLAFHPQWMALPAKSTNPSVSFIVWLGAQELAVRHAAGRPVLQSVSNMVAAMDSILNVITEKFAAARIYVGTVPPTSLAHKEWVDVYNRALMLAPFCGRHYGWTVVKCVTLDYSGFNPDRHTYDGMMPNAVGEEILAKEWVTAIVTSPSKSVRTCFKGREIE